MSSASYALRYSFSVRSMAARSSSGVAAVGAGCFFAALNVKYRDVRFAVPFIVQMWMFLSVIVSFSQISEKMANWGLWPHLWGLNPLVCAVEGFRWALLFPHTDPIIQPPWTLLAVGLPVSLLLFFAGITYFRRMERQFADIV